MNGTSQPSPRRSWPLLLGGGVWALAVVAGMAILWEYSITPGAAAAPRFWPEGSRMERDPATPTLVMLAHPRCPCTRASVEELARVMARCPGRVKAYVLMLRPAGLPDDWATTDLWRSAAIIPGVTVMRDDGGNEARLFNAETSGQTLLYDAAGRLLFSGGITDARGHVGDNAGADAVVSFLTRGTAAWPETSVFGCSLVGPGSS